MNKKITVSVQPIHVICFVIGIMFFRYEIGLWPGTHGVIGRWPIFLTDACAFVSAVARSLTTHRCKIPAQA